jgi:hypothetical protein
MGAPTQSEVAFYASRMKPIIEDILVQRPQIKSYIYLRGVVCYIIKRRAFV